MKPSKPLVVQTLLFLLYISFIYNAIALVDSHQQLLEVGIVNYLWTVSIILFSIPILKNKPSPFLILGVCLALAGIVITISQRGELSLDGFLSNLQQNPFAYAYTLIAAVTWGLYSNFNRLWRERLSLGSLKYIMLFTSFIALVGTKIFPFPAGYSATTLVELLYLSFVLSLAYYLWEIATRDGNFILVGVLSYLTPLITTVFACLYLDIRAGPQIWFGCLLLIAGALISKFSIRERPF